MYIVKRVKRSGKLKKWLGALCVALSLLLPLEAAFDAASPATISALAEDAQGDALAGALPPESAPASSEAEQASPVPASEAEQTSPVPATEAEPSAPAAGSGSAQNSSGETSGAEDVPAPQSPDEGIVEAPAPSGDASSEGAESAPSDDVPSEGKDPSSDGAPSEEEIPASGGAVDAVTPAPTEAPLPEFSVEDGVLLAYNGDRAKLEVPDDLGIEEIGPEAFARNEKLRSVVLPDDVTVIGARAFKDCVALERVVFPRKLRSVGDDAFSGCPKLVAVVPQDSEALRYCELVHIPYEIEGEPAVEAQPTQVADANVPPEALPEAQPTQAGSEVTPEDAAPQAQPTQTADGIAPHAQPTQTVGEATPQDVAPQGAPSEAQPSDADLSAGEGAQPAIDSMTPALDDAHLSIDAAFSPFGSLAPASAPTGEAASDSTEDAIDAGETAPVPAEMAPATGETSAPEENTSPEETTTPAETSSPEEIPTPSETASPGETTTPAETSSPEEIPTPSETASPGETSTPSETPTSGETSTPGDSPTPGETSTPDETPTPDETLLPEESLTPEEFPTPEATEVPPPDVIRFENSDLTIGCAETVAGALRPVLSVGALGAIRYQSSDEGVVRVDADGTLFGVSAGSATITAALESGEQASCTVTVCNAPASVTLQADSKTLGKGETTAVHASFDEGAFSYALTLKSSNTKVARIVDGEIVAVGKGSSTITAKAFNGKSGSLTIKVKSAPSSVRFTSSEEPLGVGMQRKLTAKLNSDAAGTIHYEIVSGSGFASLEGDVLTALASGEVAPGEVIVRAVAFNGKYAEQNLRICAAPTLLEVSAEAVELCVGQTVKQPVEVSQDCAAASAFSYASSDEGVVTVDETGAITGVGRGSAEITVTAYNGVSAHYRADVYNAPESIQASAPATIGVGEILVPIVTTSTEGARAGQCTFTSSNTKVVVVKSDGLHGKSKGSSTITVKSFNGKKTTFKLSVKAAPKDLKFTSSDLPLGVGMERELSATATNKDAGGEITYDLVDGSEFATLEGELLRANAEGDVIVRATAYNGLSVEQTLHICPAPTWLRVSAERVECGVGQSVEAPVNVETDSPAQPVYSYRSSDEDVVAVSDAGEISCKQTGSATITVRSYNGLTASYAVEVFAAPASIQLQASATDLGVGETVTPIVTTPTQGAKVGAYTLSSNNKKVIQVDGERIIAKSKGSATVTAKSYNGKRATLKFHVKAAPKGLEFTSSPDPLGVGMVRKLTASFTNSGAGGTIQYELVEGGEFATLEGSELTAVEPGEVTVSASTYGELRAEQTLQILPAPTRLTLSQDAVELSVGQTVKQPVEVSNDSGGAFPCAYLSSNTGAVTVNSSGAITGKKAGSSTISITTYNGLTASYRVDVYPAPGSVKIHLPLILGVGESVTPEVSTPTQGAKVGAYTLSSSDKSVIQVDGERIIALSKGSSTITVKTFNGKKASAKVTVKAEPAGIAFTSDPAPLGVGMTLELTTKFTNSSAAGDVQYALTQGSEFATLAGSTLTAIAPGEVTVTATAYNQVSAVQQLSICPAPTRLTLSERQIELIAGEKIDSPLTVETDTGAKPELSFTSSDPDVVTVNSAHTLTGKKAGRATINVTAYNGVSASYAVTVYAAPKSIKIEAPKTVGLGETITPVITTSTENARVGSYKLSSNNKKVLQVDGDSLYANSKGEATITAKCFNGKTATLKITVKGAPTGLRFTSSAEALGVGMRRTLSATCANGGAAAGTIHYEIVDGEAFASLEDNVLTALAPGAVTVRASAYSGISERQTISICPVTQIVELCVGQSVAFPGISTADAAYTFHSADPGVATIDASGAITGKKAGSVCVTATAGDGSAIVCGVSVYAAPATIQIDAIAAMGVGETVTPVVSTSTSGALLDSYTLSSSNAKVIAVQGLRIHAVAKGTATITAKSFNGKKASRKVTVKDAPTGLQFTSGSDALGVGMTLALSAKYTDKAAAGEIRFSISEGEEFATLEDGVLTANAPGKVTVAASCYAGVSATQVIQIFPAPTELAIDPQHVDLCVGETRFAPVNVRQDSKAKSILTYESTDGSVVAVSSSGAITGKKKGTARVIVSAYNGVSASYEVNVCAAPGNVQLALPKTMGVGETAISEVRTTTAGAQVGSYALSSSNSKVIQVDGLGIRAVGKGAATITAKSFNGKKASLKITVKDAPTGLRFTSKDAPLGVGMTLTLAATYVNSGAAGEIAYELVSGSEFATLEGDVLTAVAPGEVTVRASTYAGTPATQKIRIFSAPTELKTSEASVTVCVGETIDEPVRLVTDSGAIPDCSYGSSDANIVGVSATGAITGKKKGTARITIVSYSGASASYDVTVCAAPASIKVSAPSVLGVGETAIPLVTTPTAGAQVGSYTLSSNSTKVITVSGHEVRAVGKGVATITAKSFNGKKATCKITVKDAPTGLKFSSSDAPMGVGMKRTLKAAFTNSGAAGEISFAITAGGDCATLEGGVLTARAEGSVTVTASAYSGKPATQTIEILPAPTSIQSTGAQEVTLAVGETHAFALEVLPENAVAEYTYASSDDSVAHVDENGGISAMKAGTALISVTTHNDLRAQIQVQVVGYSSIHGTVAIAHRGASGYRRENTLEAFTYAAQMGAQMFETDVHLTADGQLVLYHDAKLPSGAAIANLTLEQIKARDPLIPTLDEALDCMSGLSINMLLEFKAVGDEVERKAVDRIKAHGMLNRVTFCSFNWACIQRLHSLAPSVETIVVTKTAADVKKVIASPQSYRYISGISVLYSQLTADQVRSLHLLGLKVVTWTVNKATEVKREVQMGVDAITTNYPDLVIPYQK